MSHEQDVVNVENGTVVKITVDGGASKFFSRQGDRFTPANITRAYSELPPGVYKPEFDATGALHFIAISPNLSMPDKVYGQNNRLCDMALKVIRGGRASTGLLMSGLRGSGKTLAAKQLLNELIADGWVVILIQTPTVLSTVNENVTQRAAFMFDEFEKTHDREPEANSILSVLDGTSSSTHARVWLFTVNRDLIPEPMLDRPGRILFRANYERLDMTAVREMVSDVLTGSSSKYVESVLVFLELREVLTWDVVSEVLNTVKTLDCSPFEIEAFFNAKRRTPTRYEVHGITVREDGTEEEQLLVEHLYVVSAWENRNLAEAVLMINEDDDHMGSVFGSGPKIKLVARPSDTLDPQVWMAEVALSRTQFVPSAVLAEHTWGQPYLWLDDLCLAGERPAWMNNYTKAVKNYDHEVSNADTISFNRWAQKRSMFGGSTATLRVRIVPKYTSAPRSYAYSQGAAGSLSNLNRALAELDDPKSF